jgi:predicted short-subunit dehydrogenase-like oxidoreductase (DUF2520 family)
MSKAPWNIAVVGPGRVGLVFGQALRKKGDTIVAVVARHARSAARGATYLGCRRYGKTLDVLPRETSVVLLTVPHAAVEETAWNLARTAHLRFKHLSVCHASGMLTADALAPLARKGTTVVSFHPLQTFPRDFSPDRILPSLPGIWYGIDGSPRGRRFARALALRLGGRTVVIPPGLREFYHAACVVASNHLTALLGVLEEMHGVLGRKRPGYLTLFQPIMDATLGNVASSSPGEALSGPVARGGTATIARHCESLRQYAPTLLPYYTAMTMATVRLARANGAISARKVEEFRGLLEVYHTSSKSTGKRR